MYRKSLFTKAEFINAKLNYKIQVYGCKIRKKQNSKQVIFFARKNTTFSRTLFSHRQPFNPICQVLDLSCMFDLKSVLVWFAKEFRLQPYW